MAVNDAQFARAVADELLDHVLERVDQSSAVQTGGTGKEVAATRFLMRLVAIGKGRRDQCTRLSGSAPGKFGGQQNVDMHRHVVAMLLHRPQGNQDRHVAVLDTRLIGGPRQFGGENSILWHRVLLNYSIQRLGRLALGCLLYTSP